jgi:hypothetical protein
MITSEGAILVSAWWIIILPPFLSIMPIVFSLLFQNIRVKLCFFCKEPLPLTRSSPENLETDLVMYFWDLFSVSYVVCDIVRGFCVKKWLALISVPKNNRHYRKERREYVLVSSYSFRMLRCSTSWWIHGWGFHIHLHHHVVLALHS